MLTLTENAVRKIQSFLEADAAAQGKSLRVSLQPSGCAGFEYRLGFDEKKPEDVILPQSGFEVVMDSKSSELLAQAVIDFHDDSAQSGGSGFKISNPLEKGSCGCGKSKQF